MPWLEQPILCSVWEHRTVQWCTGQCPVCQAGSCKLAALGISSAVYGYNSPECPVCTGLSGEPTVSCAICARHVDRANGREGAPDCPVCTGQCPVRQRLPGANGRLRQIRKEIRTGQCPVRQATEGKISLPGMFSTAPSCLGAIKGTPRRMENIKHTQSIPKHQDFDSTHLFLRDSI
jgi:hypothetical protein